EREQVEAAAAAAAKQKAPGQAQQQMLIVLLCIVVVLVIAVGFLVVQLSSLDSKVSDARDEVRTTSDRVGSFEGQMKVLTDDDHALHAQLDALAAADPRVVAGRVQPSVWTLETDAGLGSGWVVNSDGTTSNFVTNYHVVRETYESGDK